MLNACLTVRRGSANSHKDHGWEQFTSQVLKAVSKQSRGVVFLAWGTPAQQRIDSIGIDKTKHCILRSVHPSPLSAARGFFECKHFIKANEWLSKRYGVEGEVEWDCLAEGKRGRGGPSKEPIHSEGKKEAENKQEDKNENTKKTSATETVKKGPTAKDETVIEAGSRERKTAALDEYDFDAYYDAALEEMAERLQ